MSIEDINYLYKNSIKDNSVILIDSKQRDKKIFQSPNSYSITFDNPIKYVYGIEILDATIPRTMYQIDVNNNNLKIVIGDANYHIYNDTTYDPNSFIDTNNNNDELYGNTTSNYINNLGTDPNVNGNGSLLWLRDITLDPEDMDMDVLIDRLNSKLSILPLSTNNNDVSIMNNKKINVRSVSNPSPNLSKLLFYSGSDPNSNGIITDSVPIYILSTESNISETIGFDEQALSSSNEYISIISDLEKRNIYMLLNNITITDWNDITKSFVISSPNGITTFSKVIWESKTNRERTLITFGNYDILHNTSHTIKFLEFEFKNIDRIFKSGINKADIGKFNLSTNAKNIYNSLYPDFKKKETIEYIVKWNRIDKNYTFENKISNIGSYLKETDKPHLHFILGNTYKFDVSDISNTSLQANIKYTSVQPALDTTITIELNTSTSSSPVLIIFKAITGTGTNGNIDIEGGNYLIRPTLDETAESLREQINKHVYFVATIDISIDIIQVYLDDNIVIIENINKTSNDASYSITPFFTPKLRFSLSENSNSSETDDPYFPSIIEDKNITIFGTPGTTGAYIQYDIIDTDRGANPNTIYGTPNNFFYSSSPNGDNSTSNPHKNSGNNITLERSAVHKIQSPGMVNLIGERIITLKSKTIEEHLYKNETGTSSIGIGLFKLGVSGYSQNRLDFSTLQPKDFHPIGKLNTIDFRFEINNDILYDFKGINHHFLLNIKYYVPFKKQEDFNYTLNTNYNPNFIEYYKNQYEKDNNSEEELEDLTKNFKANFLEKEKEYNYSSDEDLEYIEKNNNITDSETESSSTDEEYITSNRNNLTPYNDMY